MRTFVSTPVQKERMRSGESVKQGKISTYHSDRLIRTVLETPLGGGVRCQEGGRRISLPDSGHGEPLSLHAQQAMGAHFGFDFSRIRIHKGSETAAALGAKAFAGGVHIHFSPGRNPDDRTLLAHELAHAVQQATGEANGLKGVAGDASLRRSLENEAIEAGSGSNQKTGGTLRPLPLASFTIPILQFEFEEDLLAELRRLTSPAQEGLTGNERQSALDIITQRRARLRLLFNALSREDARRYYERLRERRPDDPLSERFYDILAAPTRRELLHLLERKFNRPEAAAEVEPEPAVEEPSSPMDNVDWCEPWTPVNDDTVQRIIDDALSRSHNNVSIAFGDVQRQRNTPEHCCDLNYAAADHYLFMRDAVGSGALRPVWPITIGLELPARLITSSLPDDRFLRTGICPVSPPDIHVTQWGLRGARDGEGDYREGHPGSRPSPARLPPDLLGHL